HLLDDGNHLVGEATRDDQQVRLPRGRAEHFRSEASGVVAGGHQIHHFNSTASQTERERPHGRLLRPPDELVDGRHEKLLIRVQVQSRPPRFHTYRSPSTNTMRNNDMAARPYAPKSPKTTVQGYKTAASTSKITNSMAIK